MLQKTRDKNINLTGKVKTPIIYTSLANVSILLSKNNKIIHVNDVKMLILLKIELPQKHLIPPISDISNS